MLTSHLLKIVYFLIVLALLLPSIGASIATVYARREARRIERETPREPGNVVYVIAQEFTFDVGGLEIPIYPRVWSAVLVIFGATAWLAGVIFILFVRDV